MARKRRASIEQAERELAGLLDEVAQGGQPIIIERDSQPVAALVGIDNVHHAHEEPAQPAPRQGALALIGLWRDVGDEPIDALIAELYADREREAGRPVDLTP